MTSYLWWAFIIIAIWKLGWHLVYSLTGFHIGYVTINNGISLNSVSLLLAKVSISASTIRLRLWGNSKRFIITDLKVEVHKTHSEKKDPSKRRDLPSGPLSIYPKRAQKVVELLLKIIPTLDFEFKSTSVIVGTEILDLETIRLTLESHRRGHAHDSMRFGCELKGYNISSKSTAPTSRIPPLSIGEFTTQIKPSVHLKTGVVNEIAVRVLLDDLRINVFQTIKQFLLQDPQSTLEPKKKEPEKEKEVLDRLLALHKRFVLSVKNISIDVCNCRIEGIPCLPAYEDSDLETYFNQEEPELSISIFLKSWTMQFEHLIDMAAGFTVLFNNNLDRPFQLISSVSLLQCNFIHKRFDESCQRQHFVVDEFWNIPNMSFTLRTNILDHLAKGLGFRDCTMEFYSSISNPVLDLSHKEFALLAYNYIIAKKALVLKKLKKQSFHTQASKSNSESEDTDDDFTRIDDSSPPTPTSQNPTLKKTLFGRLVHLLNEFYPRIGVKCAIEQPRAVIRVEDDDKVTIRIMDLSYSMMYIHVMTTAENDYDAVCQFLHPCLAFTERFSDPENEKFLRMTEEVLGAQSLKFQLTVLKNLKFKSYVLIESAYANLAKPDVLNGINKILTETTKQTAKYFQKGSINQKFNRQLFDSYKGKEKAPEPVQEQQAELESDQQTIPEQQNNTPLEGFFKKLPSWFVAFEFELTDLQVKLGCTSPLLPPHIIEDLSPEAMVNTSHIVQLTLDSYRILLQNDEIESNKLIAESSSINSDETLTRDDQATYWKVFSTLNSFTLLAIEEGLASTSVLDLEKLEANFSAVLIDEKDQFLLEIGAPLLSGCIDRHKIFNIMGLMHLIIQTIVLPLKKVQMSLKKEMEAFERFAGSGHRASFDNALLVRFNLNKIDYVAELSDEFKTRLQVFDLSLNVKDKIVTTNTHLIRLLADSPTVQGYWSRLLCIDSLNVVANDPNEEEKIVARTEGIRIVQAYRFVIYKLFDNISVFSKIIKHLVKSMKTEEKTTIIWPNESKPIKLPQMKITSNKVYFTMEDDPFESELGMIYQLGLVEQRKRIELEMIYEEKAKQGGEDQESLQSLRETISRLWIRKVNTYKSRLAQEIHNCKRFLVGNEADLELKDNHKICAYFEHAPLLSIFMTGFDARVSTTQFPLSDLPKFIYQLGQQVPTDTKYNLMVPMYLDLCVEELRINLRDYPLPLLHLPRALNSEGRGKALFMRGHLIICEALVLAKEHMRRLDVNLSRIHKESGGERSKYEKLLINKSMSTVKLYSDLDIRFGSDAPCRFVWGQSYQFGIQQSMLNFDSFSKPPIDPSPKLGFWDKMRYIIHGKLLVKAEGSTAIEVAFKGGRDPYNLFGDSSGFILSFQQGISWMINENDDSLLFFDIQAQKVAWYIPNYLSAPLTSWTRDSSESTYISDIPDLVTSIHGYYLNDIPPHKASEDAENPDLEVNEKSVIELDGGVHFKLGFLLQRFHDGKISDWCRPHYDINLYEPSFCGKNHDSYAGFRTSRIHMAITMIAFTDSSSNTIHLTPGTFQQFFKWWKLFQGNMMLPVRRGKVFGELKKSAKFSQNLFTIKFLFHLKELFMSHVYWEDHDEEEDIVKCYGLKAKVGEFLVDLHQRKEERAIMDRQSDEQKKVFKMTMNLGEVILSKIDLRVLYAEVIRNIYSQAAEETKFKFVTFDNDEHWCDRRDLHEAFVSTQKAALKLMEVHPMMYSERFSYIRDTSNVGKKSDWGSEETHACKLHSTDVHEVQAKVYEDRIADLQVLQEGLPKDARIEERIEILKSHIRQTDRARRTSARRDSVQDSKANRKENFHNRFVLSAMYLKWNVDVRNRFMKYLFFVQLSSDFRKYLSYDLISMLESNIQSQESQAENRSSAASVTHTGNSRPKLGATLNKFDSSQLRLDNFDEILRHKSGPEEVREDFKIEIVSPQIQLHAEDSTDAVVIISAPVLEMKILKLLALEGNSLLLNAKELESRYGALLHNASVTVVDKSDVKNSNFLLEAKPYGTRTNWPPWLGPEICRDIQLSDPRLAVVKHMSVMLTYDKVLALAASLDLQDGYAEPVKITDGIDDRANRLRVDVPKLEVSSTSKQYFALYTTVIGLLMYVEQSNVLLREKLSQLKFSMDFEDHSVLYKRLVSLHHYLDTIKLILRGYSFRYNHLNNEDLNLYWLLNSEREAVSTEIVFLLTSILSGDTFSDTSAKPLANWRIGADEIILHMLQDNQKPILDLKITKARYKRRIREDGSNDNRIELNYIEGINLMKNSIYLKFVESIAEAGKEDLITIDWSMNREVGGIRIMEYFDIKSQPLTINLDEVIGRQLMAFVFHANDENDLSRSTLSNLNVKDDQDDKNNESKENLPLKSEKNEEESGQDSLSMKKQLAKRFSSMKGTSTSSGEEPLSENVVKMMERSKKYISVGKMTFSPFNVLISLRFDKGIIRWLNVTNILLELPGFTVEKRVISMLEVAELMKKMVIKTLLSHIGRILENKITSRRYNRRRLRKSRLESAKAE